jgi:predicted lipoprotein
VTHDVILPDHVELATGAAALADAIDALVEAPDQARLDAAQAAWRAARAPWMRSLVFRVGPVKDDLYESKLDQWPVDPEAIAAEIAGAEALTPAHLASLGANKRGLHTIELLMFDPVGGDAAVLATLTATPRTGEYLAAAAELVATDAARLRDAWAPDDGGFVDRVIDLGGASPFETIKESTDALVNESVFLAELVADAKLGKPMGVPTGGDPRVELVQSLPSDGAVDDMLDNVRGVRAAWDGRPASIDDGPPVGLGALDARRSTAIAARVERELDAAEAALAAIPRPFADALLAEAPEVEAAWNAVRELRLTLATEVIAALGATLSFNDNDGD